MSCAFGNMVSPCRLHDTPPFPPDQSSLGAIVTALECEASELERIGAMLSVRSIRSRADFFQGAEMMTSCIDKHLSDHRNQTTAWFSYVLNKQMMDALDAAKSSADQRGIAACLLEAIVETVDAHVGCKQHNAPPTPIMAAFEEFCGAVETWARIAEEHGTLSVEWLGCGPPDSHPLVHNALTQASCATSTLSELGQSSLGGRGSMWFHPTEPARNRLTLTFGGGAGEPDHATDLPDASWFEHGDVVVVTRPSSCVRMDPISPAPPPPSIEHWPPQHGTDPLTGSAGRGGPLGCWWMAGWWEGTRTKARVGGRAGCLMLDGFTAPPGTPELLDVVVLVRGVVVASQCAVPRAIGLPESGSMPSPPWTIQLDNPLGCCASMCCFDVDREERHLALLNHRELMMFSLPAARDGTATLLWRYPMPEQPRLAPVEVRFHPTEHHVVVGAPFGRLTTFGVNGARFPPRFVGDPDAIVLSLDYGITGRFMMVCTLSASQGCVVRLFTTQPPERLAFTIEQSSRVSARLAAEEDSIITLKSTGLIQRLALDGTAMWQLNTDTLSSFYLLLDLKKFQVLPTGDVLLWDEGSLTILEDLGDARRLRKAKPEHLSITEDEIVAHVAHDGRHVLALLDHLDSATSTTQFTVRRLL